MHQHSPLVVIIGTIVLNGNRLDGQTDRRRLTIQLHYAQSNVSWCVDRPLNYCYRRITIAILVLHVSYAVQQISYLFIARKLISSKTHRKQYFQ